MNFNMVKLAASFHSVQLQWKHSCQMPWSCQYLLLVHIYKHGNVLIDITILSVRPLLPNLNACLIIQSSSQFIFTKTISTMNYLLFNSFYFKNCLHITMTIFFSLFFNTCLSCYLLIYFGKCDYSLFQQLNVKCTSFANQCHACLKIRN